MQILQEKERSLESLVIGGVSISSFHHFIKTQLLLHRIYILFTSYLHLIYNLFTTYLHFIYAPGGGRHLSRRRRPHPRHPQLEANRHW